MAAKSLLTLRMKGKPSDRGEKLIPVFEAQGYTSLNEIARALGSEIGTVQRLLKTDGPIALATFLALRDKLKIPEALLV